MQKILVTYSTIAGSTEEVSAAIRDVLQTDAVTVDLLPVDQVSGHLHDYGAVIVASAIRVGMWLPDAVDFVRRYQAYLSTIPVGYVTVCMRLAQDADAYADEVYHYLDEVRELVEPVSEAAFAGVMDLKKLTLPTQLVVRMMRVPRGDFRDWTAIETWAQDFKLHLSQDLLYH